MPTAIEMIAIATFMSQVTTNVSYNERSQSVQLLKSCLERSAATVSNSVSKNMQADMLRQQCRSEESRDRDVWIKWDGNVAAVGIAIEKSQEKLAFTVLEQIGK